MQVKTKGLKEFLGIEAGYLVNLATRPNRLRAAQVQMKAAGLDWVDVFPAVDGTRLPKLPGLTAGMAGCWHSHRQIWEDAAARGLQRYLVLEDDFIVQPYALNIIELSMPWIERSTSAGDMDILLLGSNIRERGEKSSDATYRPLLAWGTQAYVVMNEKATQRLLATLDVQREQVDIQLSNEIYAPRALNVHAFWPSLFPQGGNWVSDVQSQLEEFDI